jgi:hypothetical protein
MRELCLAVAWNWGVLTVIGFGPALLFLSGKRRLETALALAPGMGFITTGIIGTILVSLDHPVSQWAGLWSMTAALLSVAAILIVFLKRRENPLADVDRAMVTLYAAGSVAVLALLLWPLAAGGSSFTVLRGNGTDTFNYMAMAGYLDHEPYSWAQGTNAAALIEKHPSYGLAKELLTSRWTTSMLLSWTSRVGNIPIYRFDYGYTILCLLLAFGPAFCLALSAGLSRWVALAVAVSVCTGFWAQLVLDVRAMSQLNSLPTLLILGVTASRLDEHSAFRLGREPMLLFAAIAGMTLFYAEAVPFTLLGLALFWGNRWRLGAIPAKLVVVYALIAGAGVAAMVPVAPYLVKFFTGQLRHAAQTVNNWHKAYFGWLYSNPLTGFWGFSTLSDPLLGAARPFVQGTLTLLGLSLTAAMVFWLWRMLRSRDYPAALSVSAAFTMSALVQFLFLLGERQLWAAAKGLSFGYAFWTVGVAAFVLTRSGAPRGRWVRYVVLVWIVLQGLLGLQRVAYAYAGMNYHKYIWHHGEYRKHDWNMEPFVRTLSADKDASVWLCVSSPWLAEYMGYALGWEVRLTNFSGIQRGGSAKPVDSQMISRPPGYILMEKAWLATVGEAGEQVASNSECALIRATDSLLSRPLILGMTNPNGIERDEEGGLFLWLGGPATRLTLLSPQDGWAVFNARFQMGPSLPGVLERRLHVRSEPDGRESEITVNESTGQFKTPVHRGINYLQLEVLDQPSVPALPNGDTRPLLLRMEKMGWKSSPGQRKEETAVQGSVPN